MWNGNKLSSEGRFSIQAGNPELNNLVARPEILRNLSLLSGGQSHSLSGLKQLTDSLLSDEMAKPIIFQPWMSNHLLIGNGFSF